MTQENKAKVNKKNAKSKSKKKGEAYKDVDLDNLNAFVDDFMDAPPLEKDMQDESH